MNKFKFKKLLILGLVIIIAISIFGCKKDSKGMVADVNGVGITEEEFNEEFQVFKNEYERQLGADALKQVGQDGKTLGEQLKEEVIELLIMEKIISKEAESLNIVVTEEDVDKQVKAYVEETGGQEAFDELLKRNNYTYDYFVENMRKGLMVEKHKESYLNTITISDKESKDYFDLNKDDIVLISVSHILLGSEEDANKIIKRLNEGEDFATLATLESLHSVSAAQGGDLGYIGKGYLTVAEFEDAAFALKEGEISGVVKSEVGYHVIKLDDKKDTYEELKENIVQTLKNNQYLANIQSQRDKAKVNIYLNTKAE